MRLALIPPISLLADTYQTDYQLMLPQNVGDPEYARVYGEHCAAEGTFVILDNGANEEYEATPQELIELAWEFGADEIVIPDVIGDKDATIAKAEEFLAIVKESTLMDNISCMLVLQGKTWGQFTSCAAWAANNPLIKTLGIPRHAAETLNDRTVRARLANTLQYTGLVNTKMIHFLGGVAHYPDEPSILSHYKLVYQDKIRGMDTSLPYNYAFHDTSVNEGDGKSIKRPDHYFERGKPEFDEVILPANVEAIKRWART